MSEAPEPLPDLPDTAETPPAPATTAPESLPETPPSARSRMSVRRIVLLGLGLLVLGFGSWHGWNWYQQASSHEETDNASLSAHLLPVSSRIGGTVAAVLVEDNSYVHKGQLLVQLDTRDLALNLRRAQAALEVSRRQAQTAQTSIQQARSTHAAQLEQAEGNLQSAEASIASLQGAVEEARQGLNVSQSQLRLLEVNLARAAQELQRSKHLRQEGVSSQQQLESAQAVYDGLLAQKRQAEAQIGQSRARVSQAQDNLLRARAQLQVSEGGVTQASSSELQIALNQSQFATANANVHQAELAVEEARNQLMYAQIKAQEDGFIGKRAVEPGQRLQAGQTLMSIVSPKLWVIANFKETQLTRIQVGQPVEIHVDAYPDQSFKGQVESLAPGTGSLFSLLPPDNATGNFTKVIQRVPVKIQLDASGTQRTRLAPGMSAVVSVDVRVHPGPPDHPAQVQGKPASRHG